jgi:hypothetical protein
MLQSHTTLDLSGALQAATTPVLDVDRLVIGTANSDFTVRFHGRLKLDSLQAYEQLQENFKALQHDAFLRSDDQPDLYIVEARRANTPKNKQRAWLSLFLFCLTFLAVLWTGANGQLAFDHPETPATAGWQELLLGLPYALTLMGILLAHEFGHYFVGRYHREATSLPLFIPAPFTLFGTMGAVIFGSGSIKNRRVLLDIGIAGPLAGLVVAIPALFYGLALSRLTPLTDLKNIILEGNSLFYLLAKYITFGQLLPAPTTLPTQPLLYWLGYWLAGLPAPQNALDVSLHPIAWAGWAGLFITGLNLLPVGQLDGGHAVYGLLGKRARIAVPIVMVALGLLSLRWVGWLLWLALLWFFGQRPASVRDEVTDLDPKRQGFAILMLVIFVLVFIPVPLLTF